MDGPAAASEAGTLAVALFTEQEYVDGMSFRGGLRTMSFWIQYALLSVFGPAQLSDEADPRQQLKRKYGRSPDA